MGVLKGARFYIAGPMDRAKDAGDGWRDKITPILQGMGILVLDPRKKPIDMGLEDVERRVIRNQNIEKENWEAVESDKDIRQIDLRAVDVTDATIVYIDMEQYPFGTVEEIVLANREKKPVLAFIEGGKKNAPHWLFWMIGHEAIFNNMDEVIEHLHQIDNGTLKHKRWVLFDWEKLIRETEAVYGPL